MLSCVYLLLVALVATVNGQLSLSSLPCDIHSVPKKDDVRHGKIVGGSSATRGSIPYIVSLTRRGRHFCGASILNERWILTAAHCMCSGFDEIMLPSRIKAVVGLHKISEFDPNNGIGDQKNGKAYAVDFQKIVVHPSYDCRRSNDDIALLHLRTPIAFSSTVQPICVADIKANNTYDDQMAYIAGWGQTHENYEISDRVDVLQSAQVDVWTNHDCQDSFQKQHQAQTIRPTQMCAGKRSGGIDACWADSGGPMVSSDAKSVIGIVSTGIGCARVGLPGIYTRVSEYTSWIEEVISAPTVEKTIF